MKYVATALSIIGVTRRNVAESSRIILDLNLDAVVLSFLAIWVAAVVSPSKTWERRCVVMALSNCVRIRERNVATKSRTTRTRTCAAVERMSCAPSTIAVTARIWIRTGRPVATASSRTGLRTGSAAGNPYTKRAVNYAAEANG